MVLSPIFDVGCHDAHSHRSRSPSAGESRERSNHIMSLVRDFEVDLRDRTYMFPYKTMNILNQVNFIDGKELGSEFDVTRYTAQSAIWGWTNQEPAKNVPW